MPINNKGSNNPNWKGGLIERICLECKTIFKVKRKDTVEGKGKYCSLHCRAIGAGKTTTKTWMARRVKKKCVVCDKVIFIKTSHVETEGTYCSKVCMSKGYSKLLVGKGNPNYKHGLSYLGIHIVRRKQAKGRHSIQDISRMLSRQRNECAFCKISLLNGYEVDHIIPVSKGGSHYIGNIQILCISCNRKKFDKLYSEFRYGKRMDCIFEGSGL